MSKQPTEMESMTRGKRAMNCIRVCHGERTTWEAAARQEGRRKEEGTRAEHTRPNERRIEGMRSWHIGKEKLEGGHHGGTTGGKATTIEKDRRHKGRGAIKRMARGKLESRRQERKMKISQTCKRSTGSTREESGEQENYQEYKCT